MDRLDGYLITGSLLSRLACRSKSYSCAFAYIFFLIGQRFEELNKVRRGGREDKQPILFKDQLSQALG